jgi:hypothetical protein
MTVKELFLSASRQLDRVLLGTSVKNEQDAWSQLNTVGTAYIINGLVIFAVVCAILFMCGYGHPFHRPLQFRAFLLPLGIANVLTFLAMLIASLTWQMHSEPLQKLLSYEGSLLFPTFLNLIILVLAVGFTLIVFVAPRWEAIVVSWSLNSLFIESLMGERLLRSAKKTVRE